MSEFLRETFPWMPPEWAEWAGWALIALGLLLLIVVVWRLASGSRSRAQRRSEARLAIVDAAEVDQRRRLVLVRRDGVEHLLMIGGPGDIVIETGIGASEPEPARVTQTAALRHDPAPRPTRPLSAAADASLASGGTGDVRDLGASGASAGAKAQVSKPPMPPRVEVPSVEREPKPALVAPAAGRREPGFAKTAGATDSATTLARPSASVVDLKTSGKPEAGARRRQVLENSDQDELVAEIDDILARTSKDRT